MSPVGGCWQGKLEAGQLLESRRPLSSVEGRMFGFLCLVPSWKWEQKLRKRVVLNRGLWPLGA